EQDLVGIGQRRTVVERKANSVRGGRQRNDAVGRALRRAIANREKVVIVIDQLVRGGQPFANRSAALSYAPRNRRIELGDESRQLLLRGRGGSGIRAGWHGLSGADKIPGPSLSQHPLREKALMHEPLIAVLADVHGNL